MGKTRRGGEGGGRKKRGLWQQEREIITGLLQSPPVAAWREVMVMGTDCSAETQAAAGVGEKQDTISPVKD